MDPTPAPTPSTYVPLNDTTRAIVVTVHFLTFLVAGWTISIILKKLPTLQNRIWSPFLLTTAIVWLQLGAAFEIANHFYEGNFELRDPKTDFINGVFYFFNFAGNYLNALALRKKNVPFCRIPGMVGDCKSGCFDLVVMLFDWFMVIGIFITLPVYFALGRADAVSTISSFGAIAGVGILFRLWRNLGPNRATLWGGIGFFFFAILGVIMNAVYRATGIEFLHTFIGGSFVFSLVPFTIAIIYSVEVEEESGGGEDAQVQDDGDGDVEMESIPL